MDSQLLEEAEFALVLAYLKKLRRTKFYGIVELTLQAGEIKNRRAIESAPIGAMAAELLEEVPEKYRGVLRERYKDHKSFGE